MATPKKTKKSTAKSNAAVRREYRGLANVMAETDKKSFNLVRDMTGDEGGDVWDTEMRAYIDARNLKNLFFSESWPYTIIDLIAMKISNQRLVIMRDYPLPNGNMEARVEQNHPYQKTIDKPNPQQDYHAWMYCIVVDLICIGNGIVWKGLTGYNLWQIPSDEIVMDFDKTGALTKYRRLASNDLGTTSTTAEFDPKNVIHIKRPNPNSLFYGLSPFVPGRKSVLFDRYSTEYLNNYYIKGTTPGLTLEMTADANEKNAVRMLKSFELAYTGRRSQRRTMVLPKGVTAKNVATSLADQQLKDYLDRNRETILALLKVPKHEVGLQTAGSLGSEEYKTSLTNFWSATLKPTMRMIAGAMTDGLKEYLGEGCYFSFDLDDVEALKDDILKKTTIGNAMLQTHTVNEVRQQIYDKPPIEGGDVLASSRQPLPYGMGLSIAPNTIEAKSTEIPNVQTVAETPADRMIKKHKGWFDSRQDKIANKTKEPTKAMIELAGDLFMDQGKAVIESLQKNLEEKAASTPNKDKLKKQIRTALDSFQEDWVSKYRKILSTTIDFGYDLTIDVPFKMPETEAIIAIGEQRQGKRHDVIEARGITAFEHMNETTTDDVMNTVKNSIDKGETIQQITEKIATKYANDIENTLYRAERIARTEVLTALSLGQAASMEVAAELMPDLQKMWLSGDDERVRGNPAGLYPIGEGKNAGRKADHFGLHGQIVKHDDPFIDPNNREKLMFPRDPSASAGSVINCRCSMVTLPEKDMQDFAGDAAAQPFTGE